MTVVMVVAGLLLQQPGPTRIAPGGDAHERPVFRALKDGEQRDEGLLRRITCPARGPVTFVVNAKETKEAKESKVVQYTASALTSVDFIVYRKDFHGPVTCEGFGAGEPVYVTWKPDGKGRRAIAIEFLPKEQ